jgi:hypothetical protein
MTEEMVINMENNKPTDHWSEKDWKKFRKWLVGMLHVTTVTVTFTKKDGSERIMNCTLVPELLPPVEIKEDKEPRKKSDDVVAVYDIEAKGWRSFTLKNVIRVNMTID